MTTPLNTYIGTTVPAATALAGVDKIPVIQGGITKSAAVSLLPSGGGVNPAPTRAGFYFTMPGTVASSALTLGQMRATPVLLGASVTVDRIGINVTTAGAAGSIVRLGIYNDTGSLFPNALVLDAGTVDTTTTGFKEITISQALTAGFSWLVELAEVAAPSVNHTTTTPYMISHTGAGLASNNINVVTSNSTTLTGAFPATFPVGGANSSSPGAPRILLRAV